MSLFDLLSCFVHHIFLWPDYIIMHKLIIVSEKWKNSSLIRVFMHGFHVYKLRDYTRTLNCRRESERINVFNPYVAAVLQNINKQQKDYEKGKWD